MSADEIRAAGGIVPVGSAWYVQRYEGGSLYGDADKSLSPAYKLLNYLVYRQGMSEQAARQIVELALQEPNSPELQTLTPDLKEWIANELHPDGSYYVLQGEGITPQIVSREDVVELQGLRPGSEEYHNTLISLGLIPEGTPYVDPVLYNKAMDALKPYIDPDTGAVDVTAALRDERIDPAYLDILLGAGTVEKFERNKVRLADGNYITIDAWNKLDEKYKTLGLEHGLGAIENQMTTDWLENQVATGQAGSIKEARQQLNEIKSGKYLVYDYESGEYVPTYKKAAEQMEELYQQFPEAKPDTGTMSLSEAIEQRATQQVQQVAQLPKFLQDAWAKGPDAYKDAVADYDNVMRTVQELTTSGGGAAIVGKDLLSKYRQMLQPAGMSDEDYAKIAPFIKLDGFDSAAAYKAGAPVDVINRFIMSTAPPEVKSQIESGELTLLPYGDIQKTEVVESLPDTIKSIVLESGLAGLAEYDKQVEEANRNENPLKNFWDAFYLATTGLVDDVKGAFLGGLQGRFAPVKEGDLKPEYEYNQQLTSGMAIKSLVTGEEFNPFYTAEEAAEENKLNESLRERLEQLYEDAQKTRANWVAERPDLRPVYPEGPLQAVKNNPMALLDPTLYSETIASTLPYTMASVGLILGGSLAGGPTGAIAGTGAAFALTSAVEGHQIYKEAIENGASPEKARALMTTFGALSGAVETAGDAIFAGALGGVSRIVTKALGKEVAEGIIKGAAKQYGWKNLTQDLVINWVTQAGQEAVQEIIANAAVKTVNENQPLLEGAMDALVAGAIGTAPFVLLPAGGTAVKLARTPTAEDIKAGGVESATAKSGVVEGTAKDELSPFEQRVALERVLQPTSNFIQLSMIADPVEARRVASLYNIMGARVLEYGQAKLAQSQVRKAIGELSQAKTKSELNLLEQLKAQDKALDAQLKSLKSPLQKAVDDYVAAMAPHVKADDAQARNELEEMRHTVLTDIDMAVNAIMGERDIIDVANDILETEAKIKMLADELKSADESKAKGIRATISALQAQLISLRSESARILRNTGQFWYLTKDGKIAVLSMGSPQEQLIRAKEEAAKPRQSVSESPTVKIIKEVIPRAQQAPTTPSPSVAAQAVATIYDSGYALGTTISAVKGMPDATVNLLMDAAARIDAATATIARTHARAQQLVREDLPKAIINSLMRSAQVVDDATALANHAARRAARFIRDDAPGKAVDILMSTARQIDAMIASMETTIRAAIKQLRAMPGKTVDIAINLAMDAADVMDRGITKADATLASIRYLTTEMVPAKVTDVLMNGAAKVDAAVARASDALSSAKVYLMQTLPDAAVGAVMNAAKGVDMAIAVADKAVHNVRKFAAETVPQEVITALLRAAEKVDVATDHLNKAIAGARQFVTETVPAKSVDALMRTAEGIDKATSKVQTSITNLKGFVNETAPNWAVDRLMDSASQLDNAIARAQAISARTVQLARTAQDLSVNRLMDVAASLDKTIAKAEVAIQDAREFITQGIPDKATDVLMGAAREIDRAIARVDSVVASVKSVATETIPNAAVDALMRTAEGIDKAATTAVRAISEANQFITQKLPDKAVNSLMDAAEQIDVAIAAGQKATSAVKAFVTESAPDAIVNTIMRGAMIVDTSIARARRILVEIRKMITDGIPNAATGTLMNAAAVVDSATDAATQLATVTSEYIRSLPGVATSAYRGTYYEIAGAVESIVGQLRLGIEDAVKGKPKAESWAKQLQEQRSKELQEIREEAAKGPTIITEEQTAFTGEEKEWYDKAVAEAGMRVFRVINEMEPVYGRKSYTNVLDRLERSLDTIIVALGKSGVSSDRIATDVMTIFDSIREGDIKSLNAATERLQLEAGRDSPTLQL
ncbi:MAG: hypothetical protein M0R06_11120, partial [Sphaerochaeta sp.]|nr:hypothetical protein [Sphaerochaeta sp.]